MMYQFTEEQRRIRDLVHEFALKEAAPRDRWMDENGFDHELHKKLTDIGLMGTLINGKYGGLGGNIVTGVVVLHEMARVSASAALFLDTDWLAADVILRQGTEAQKEHYLPLAAGGSVFAFGLTEACGGSDAAGLKSTAVRLPEGGWLLNGDKAWISNAGVADFYIIFAKTDPALGAKGISAFIVPKDVEGFAVTKLENKMGMRGTTTGSLEFRDVLLPPNALIGEPGAGFKYAMQALDGARICIGAISLGLSEHAFEIARDYANTRVCFGKTVSKFEGIQFKFADMATDLRAMKLLTYDAASMKAAGLRHTLEAAEAKLFCSTRATRICLECLQVLGGNGYSRDYKLERLVRDAKLLEIGEGTSEILRMLVGSSILSGK